MKFDFKKGIGNAKEFCRKYPNSKIEINYGDSKIYGEAIGYVDKVDNVVMEISEKYYDKFGIGIGIEYFYKTFKDKFILTSPRKEYSSYYMTTVDNITAVYPKNATYKHKCPKCKEPAKENMISIDCSNFECPNYGEP